MPPGNTTACTGCSGQSITGHPGLLLTRVYFAIFFSVSMKHNQQGQMLVSHKTKYTKKLIQTSVWSSYGSYYLGNIFRRLFNPSYRGCFSVNFKKLGGFWKLLSISFHMPPSALFYLYSFRNGKRLRRIFRI